jgi:hypothetical protein
VVQVCVHTRQLGASCAEQVMDVAMLLLALGACDEGAAAQSSPTPPTNSSSSAGASSNTGGWGLATSLAAAAAAGAYTAHLGGFAESGGQAGGVTSSSCVTATGDTTNAGSSASSSCGSASGRAVAVDVEGSPAVACAGRSGCSSGCRVCSAAAAIWVYLCSIERGVSFWEQPSVCASAALAVLASAAGRHGTTLQQYLKQQLLALAWRHPVPGVCGNVLCGRLEGPAAVGAVRGPRGTLCGGCRAAWYCCEACQRVAWEGHIAVCRHRMDKQ